MEEIKPEKPETKFNKTGTVNATEFGKLIGCTLNAVKAMFGNKLTEGISYLKDGRTILIDIEQARRQLRAVTNPKACKNLKLLEFLDLPGVNTENISLGDQGWVDGLDIVKTREEMARSELRLSLMQEEILKGKYIERKIVEKNLESFGIEIRNDILSLPTRIVPAARAAANDRDADNIATLECENVLIKISGILIKDIGAA